MNFYFLYKGELDEFSNFKELAVKQLEEELNINPNITSVYALILLSHFSMTEGDEFQASLTFFDCIAV
jgi:lipoprotein NlpI